LPSEVNLKKKRYLFVKVRTSEKPNTDSIRRKQCRDRD